MNEIAHFSVHLTNNVTIKFIRVFQQVKQNDVFTIINSIFIFIWYQYDIGNWYHYEMKFYIALRLSLQHHCVFGKRYRITMSLQSQYVIGLYRHVNPTKKRCRHNTACPLGRLFFFSKTRLFQNVFFHDFLIIDFFFTFLLNWNFKFQELATKIRLQ